MGNHLHICFSIILFAQLSIFFAQEYDVIIITRTSDVFFGIPTMQKNLERTVKFYNNWAEYRLNAYEPHFFLYKEDNHTLFKQTNYHLIEENLTEFVESYPKFNVKSLNMDLVKNQYHLGTILDHPNLDTVHQKKWISQINSSNL